MDRANWKFRFDEEIQRARQARERDNPGMTRVCARRAAGIIIAEYFNRHGAKSTGQSAYDLLRQLLAQPGIRQEVRDIATHLLLRVNTDFHLPIEVDLITEAIQLKRLLLE